MRSIRTRTAALLAALALALGAGLFCPSPAAACGGYGDFTPDMQVRQLVAGHYARLGRGEAELQTQRWLPQAQVVSIRTGPRGPALTSRPVAEAARAWAAADQAVTWTLGAVEVDGDMATASVRATRGALTRDEVVVLTRVDGVWWLAGKLSLEVTA